MKKFFRNFYLLLIFLFLMPLAQYIPMACLAGVLVVVSYNMSEWRTFRALMKNPRSDVAVLLVTFLLTVIIDLTVAIEVGLVLACLLFMRRVMETTDISVIRNEIDPGKESDLESHEEHLIIPRGVEVYEIDGPFFFPHHPFGRQSQSTRSPAQSGILLPAGRGKHLPEYQCGAPTGQRTGCRTEREIAFPQNKSTQAPQSECKTKIPYRLVSARDMLRCGDRINPVPASFLHRRTTINNASFFKRTNKNRYLRV